MFTQPELETILALGIILICLALSINIYWILMGWQIDAIRRAFARLVWRWGAEAYVKGLRELTEDDSYNKTYTNHSTEQETLK